MTGLCSATTSTAGRKMVRHSANDILLIILWTLQRVSSLDEVKSPVYAFVIEDIYEKLCITTFVTKAVVQ